MYRINDNKEICVNETYCTMPKFKIERLFTFLGAAQQEIVEAEIENFEFCKSISSSENSQKHSKLIEDVNIVGQRCVAFFRALYYKKLLPEG